MPRKHGSKKPRGKISKSGAKRIKSWWEGEALKALEGNTKPKVIVPGQLASDQNLKTKGGENK